MGDKKPVAKKLSMGVLELKFMKKSKEKAQIQEDNDERRLLYQDHLAALENNAEKVILLNSHYDVMTYLPCRLSFGGMEPNIEKLNAPQLKGLYEMPKEENEEAEEKEADVTDAEMAEHYTSFNQTLAKKFGGKKRRSNEESTPFVPPPKKIKSPGFLKPED